MVRPSKLPIGAFLLMGVEFSKIPRIPETNNIVI